MKEITLNIYSFGELSEKAKKKAIRDFLDKRDYSWDCDEHRETLKEFKNIFPVDIINWEVGPYEHSVDFRFTEDESIMDLKGVRLLKYIWNNYRSFLFKPKYFNIPDSVRVTDKKIRHKRLRSEVLKRGPYEGKYYNRYNSAILFENCCTLTGVCYDHDILNPIYNFLNKPSEDKTFYDLMDECLDGWAKAWSDEMRYNLSEEFAEEELTSQDIMFTEDGKVFKN